MRSLWAAGFLLRRLRSEAGVVAMLTLLVGVTAFLFAAAPRLFNLSADAALVHELEIAPAVDRDLAVSTAALTPADSGDPLGALEHVGDAYLSDLPVSLQALISGHHVVATTPRYGIAPVDGGRVDRFVAMRYQDGVGSAIRMVSGVAPTSTHESLPQARYSFDNPPPADLPPPPTVQVALSGVTAAALGVQVGDSLTGTLDISDPILRDPLLRGFRGVIIQRIQVNFSIVGIFDVVDPDAELWYADRAVERPEIGGSDEFPITYATALVSDPQYADLTTAQLPFAYQWRYFVDPGRADVAQLETLVPDLLRTQTENPAAVFEPLVNGTLQLRTGLLDVIHGYQAKRSSSEAVLAVASIGPFSLAAAAIGMLSLMLVMRRRSNLELTRSRGASGALVLAAELWEATLIAGTAAVIGLLLATAVVPGRASSLSPLLAVLSAAAAAVALVFATWPAARRSLAGIGREDPPLLPSSPRRLVLELTIVFLAVAGVLLLSQRGLVIGAPAPGQVARFDPILAAVPVLAGLAAGLVAMRLYPLPIRGLGWLAAGRRDLVPVLGLRSVGRHAAAGNLPLLLLMLTAAFGAFASVVLSSIDRGQADAAWAQVGADYRIESASPGIALGDATEVPGVEAAATGYVDRSAFFSEVPAQHSITELYAIDPAAYSAVTTGTPIDPGWPFGFNSADGPGVPGTPDNPIPAIVSDRRPAGGELLHRGSTFTVTVGVRAVSFTAVDVRSSFPGVRSGADFVVASFSLLQEAAVDGPIAPSTVWVRGVGGLEPALEAHAGGEASGATITSQSAVYRALAQTPLMATVTIGFSIALAIAVGYAALGIIAALTLTAARRRQELAFLRTLGLSARQGVWLVLVEQVPPVVLALIPGVALGVWTAALLAPSLDLAAFVGPEATVALSVAWGQIGLVATGLGLMVMIAVAASTWLARRGGTVDALRMGSE